MRPWRYVAAAALLLAACQPVPPAGGAGPDACGAGAAQSLLGQPARVLATMKFAPPTRILRPGDAMTEDFSLQRLNIEIDLHETISGVRCG